jgi:hypothetical protein
MDSGLHGTLTYAQATEHYGGILAPVFAPAGVDPFEYACSLLRVGGLEDAGWDALRESREVLDDLRHLTVMELPSQQLEDANATRWRLGLLSYVHMVEMDAPYHVLANLLRVRSGMRYVIDPFGPWLEQKRVEQQEKKERKKGKKVRDRWPRGQLLFPHQKIDVIRDLAAEAGIASAGEAFGDFYFSQIRNAIAHSDYVLHGMEFRMLHGSAATEAGAAPRPVVPLPGLADIVVSTFGFYFAFFGLHRQALQATAGLRGVCHPFDLQLKGLLEFLVDDESELCGFKVHWPNAHDSVFRRSPDGCEAVNIRIDRDGAVGFFVGERFKDHDPFSRLVQRGSGPHYTPAEGSAEPPEWPTAIGNCRGSCDDARCQDEDTQELGPVQN